MLNGRDPMGLFNDTIIETTTTYGGGSPLAAIEDVMDAILDAQFGSGAYPLTVVGTPDFGIEEYELGNVSVLAALRALANLQGWNLHWRWDATASPAGYYLTYWEPVRNAVDLSGYAPDWTFGPDDYYDVQRISLNPRGIRNKGEVHYTDSDGVEQVVSDTRSSSVAKYGTRFIRLDQRGGSIRTSAQATTLLTAVLDDLEDPPVEQVVEAPFFWPIELGDMYRFSANGVHYSTDQDLGVVGYRHELSRGRKRTFIEVAGKPAGGYRRWHLAETDTPIPDRPLGLIHNSTVTRATSGTTPEDLQTVTIPARRIGPNGAIRITATVKPSGTNAAKTAYIDVREEGGGGAQQLLSVSWGAGDEDRAELVVVLSNEDSEQSQHADGHVLTDLSVGVKSTPPSLTRDTTAPIEIVFVGDVTNASDTMTLELSRIEYLGEAPS